MKLDKLVKTLRRDVAANPAKASALGGLLLVGLYFWGPLVWKCVAGKKSASVPTAAALPLPVASSPNPQGVSAAVQNEIKLDWRAIRQWRERDPLTRTADFQLPWNQAFLTPRGADATGKKGAEEQVKPPVAADPGKLGLVLEGVVIGSKVRRAIISGKVYREHDEVKVGNNKEASQTPGTKQPELVFWLKHVSRKMVELERDGRIWRLEIGDSPPDSLPVQSKTE